MKTKITILMLAIIGWSNLATAQAPDWAWAKSAGGMDGELSKSITCDLNGNTYVTGNFGSPTLTFGNMTLTSAGGQDIFIVKYDATGNVLWAKREGGINSDYGMSIYTDLNGNLVILGAFNSPSITFGTTTLINNGSTDIFVVKYDSNGNVLWANRAGEASFDISKCITTDASGNVFITGTFSSPTITFGTTTLTNINSGTEDIFITKFDTNGNVLWAKSEGGNVADVGFSLATDASGNLFMSGSFESPSITFGAITLINTQIGKSDIFLVKYDVNGNVIWAKQAVGNDSEDGGSISTDASGNVFMTGGFLSSTINFGAITLTNVGVVDIFIVKYDSIGNVLWAKSVGGTDYDHGVKISTDVNGNVFMVGSTYSYFFKYGSDTLIGSGLGSDIVIVKYDSYGNVLYGKRVPSNDDEIPTSSCTNLSGNLYITGYFLSYVNFGTTSLVNVNPGQSEDMFIAKLNSSTTAINELAPHAEIAIAPNPFTSQTTITFNAEQKNTTIKITDVLGNEIKSTSFSGKHYVIEKGEMKSGIYFVQTIDENKNVMNKKIVVE